MFFVMQMKNDLKAFSVSSMRVRQVTSSVNSSGLEFFQQFPDYLVVIFPNWLSLGVRCSIERQVQAMSPCCFETHGVNGDLSLTTSNESLYSKVELSLCSQLFIPFSTKRLFCILDDTLFVFNQGLMLCNLRLFPHKVTQKVLQKMQVLPCFDVHDSIVSGNHVGDMHLMSLVMKCLQGPTHRDYIIVRMRREDKHFFLERSLHVSLLSLDLLFRCQFLIAQRPPGNLLLDLLVDVKVEIFSIAVGYLHHQRSHQISFVVIMCDSQDWFIQLLRQPNHHLNHPKLRARHNWILSVSFNCPRPLETSQQLSSGQIHDESSVRVLMQASGRNIH